jgi:hypothetical protein
MLAAAEAERYVSNMKFSKKKRKIFIQVAFLLVALSMILLFVSGFLLEPDRRWFQPF